MRPELAVAFVAGLFGLIPLMVQIASTRAQRRDRMTRLNQLRAELELLERINTLQGQVSVGGEAANDQTKRIVSDSLSKLLDQYNQLSEIAPSAVVSGKHPSPRQLSFPRRALLLYSPHTTSGWILHTLFYMLASIVAVTLLSLLPSTLAGRFGVDDYLLLFIFFIPIGIALLIIQRLAQHNATQSEEPDA